MKIKSVTKKILSLLLVICLILPCIPVISIPFKAAAAPGTGTVVVDPSTADSYTHMLGTAIDGNRYSGRVWFDKSVYAYGSEAQLPLHSDFIGLPLDTIKIDSNFLVVGSAIGSTTSVITTTSTSAYLDVVIILDNSSSMENTSNGTTRFVKVRDAANKLIQSITSNKNNRLAIVAYSSDSQEILPLDFYNEKANVLTLSETGNYYNRNYQFTASATPVGSSTAIGGKYTGSASGTNVQSGVNQGMKILANAENTSGRIPVVILLTDGETNHAVSNDWYNAASSNITNNNFTYHKQVAVSTLLNAAYMKYLASTNYVTAPVVYGIGVDLGAGSNANVVMDPANTVKSTANGLAKETYDLLEQWKNSSSTVTSNYGGTTWRFPQLPSNYPGTKQDVIDNINYVDKYYNIGSEDLSGTFDEILVEINEKAFVPLVDKVVHGEIEVDTPLTYVDFIGDYMEVKEFKAVTLFGKVYSISKSLEAPVITDTVNTDGTVTRKAVTTYVVESGTATNPTLGVSFNVSNAIKITVTETYLAKNVNGVYEKIGVGKQEVRATIPSTVLPLIYDKVSNDQGDISYESNRGEVVPLRLYYTVDIADEVIDSNGDIITDLISSDYLANNTNTNGSVNFYPGQYGVMNTTETINGVTDLFKGDAHAAATPALDNRYYYYQNNYPVYISATNKNGSAITWDKDEYGVLYYQGNGIDKTLNDNYKTEYLLYSDVSSLSDTDLVYTMVAFYRPTSGGKGEAVGYLTYNDWQYIKDSLAYYDNVNKVYINGYSGGAYETSETEGHHVSAGIVDSYITAKGLEKSDIICVLGIGAWRTSRLHNMEVHKTTNESGTAEFTVVPTHNEDALHDGSLVAWLGNNGKLTLDPQQGISITKTVTEAVAGAETEFVFTVTVSGTDFTPKFIDQNGNSFNSVPVVKDTSLNKTTITLTLKAGETAYVTGLPTGASYTVAEALSNYYSASYTNEAGTIKANEIVYVSVENAPKAYGDLVITKEVYHPFDGNLDNEFDFTVIISGVTQWEADNKLALPAGATYVYAGGVVTVSGIKVKGDGSATITGIPAGAAYTVTELPETGFELDTSKTVGANGTISANTVINAQFVNNYVPNPPVNADITVSGTKTVQANALITETYAFKVQKLDESTGTYVDVSGAVASVDITATIGGAIESYTISLNETYTNVGTHYYRVVEVGGTTDGMTYDTTEGLFKVTVSDPGVIDGILEVNVEAIADSTVSPTTGGFDVKVDFINVYAVDSTHADIVIKKVLNNNTGVSIPLNIFEFELSSGGVVIDTVHTDALGNATIRIPIDAEGTLVYTLTEVNGGMPGMTYDSKEYTVTIVTTTVGGKLSAEVTVSDTTDDIALFTNAYSLTSAIVSIDGTKILDNKAITDGQFEFIIKAADELYAPITSGWSQTVSNIGGGFTFVLPEYTKVGTYRYVVNEVIPAAAVNNLLDGITYDTSVYHVTVVVTDDGNGKLASAVQLTKVGTGDVTDIVFTNTYDVTGTQTITFEGDKILIGRELHGSEFTFNIDVYKDGVKQPSLTTTNLSTGVIQFPEFTYTASDIGVEYKYVVSEVLPTGAVGGKYQGVTYDDTVYEVIVNVTDNGVGGIQLVVSGDDEKALHFENTYSAEQVSVSLSGDKTLNGRDIEDGEFEFVLKNEVGSVIEIVSNVADKFNFSPITYTAAGVYKYTVSEVKGTKGGVTYDDTVYTITVTVTDNGKGILTASTVIDGIGTLSFTNNYNTQNVVIEIPGNKTLVGRPIAEDEFLFGVYHATVSGGVYTINGDVIVTTTNKADGTFVFENGVFTSPGTYHYVVKEINEGELGITYDTKQFNIKVVVTDDLNGNLVADLTVENGPIEFTNTYVPVETSVTFSGTKVLNGRSLADGEFKFVLKDSTDAVIQTVSNVGGAFTFDALVYNAVGGPYTYTVSEVNEGKGGVTYDSTVYTVTVKVVDDGHGSLVTEVTGGTSFAFTNDYSADPVDHAISGTKVLSGKALADGDFSFVLKNSSGTPIDTASNVGGTFTFGAITYNTAGTYTYTVSEVNDGKGGITYDTTVYTVTVVVTDNGDGTLSATQQVVGAAALEFNNSYNVTVNATVVLDGVKYLNGRPLNAGEFEFALKDKSGTTLQTVSNLADGTFIFAPLSFSAAGEYKYTVTEVNNGKGGVTYDDTVYDIVITVTDGGSGAYVATVDIKNNPEIIFTNGYSVGPISVPLTGKKILEGRKLNANEFEFALYTTDGRLMQTVTNKANGEFKFENITFSVAGTYTFIVTETLGKVSGVTYDNTAYTVRVIVTDNGDGTLSYTTSISGKGELVFTNVYDVVETTETITGTKVLNGRELLEGEFSFQLKDEMGNVLQTVSNKADGSFAFSPITYTEAGVYKYTVNEVKGDLGGIKYDGQKFFVTVTVSDNGLGQLVTETSITGGRIKFVNTYSAEEISVSFDGIKTLEGKTLADGQFSFVLTDKDGNLLQTVKNDANGIFSFAPITYSAAGEYLYSVTEVNDGQGGIVYDESVFVITVKVVDYMAGKLTAQVIIGGDGELEFTNSYTVSPVSVPLSATKTLEGKELTQGAFVFYLKDEKGAVLQTVSNSASGVISFNDLVFTAEGTYVYTVNELIGSVNGMTYDDTVYTITVEVTDNGDGTLTAVKTVDGGEIVFNNVYDAVDATVVLEGSKVLNGRELTEGEFSFALTDASETVLQTVSNKADGSFVFDTLTFDSEGVYQYTVYEVKGEDETVIYDTTVYNVVITVIDEDGVLNATVAVEGDELVFTNAIDEPEVSEPDVSAPDESEPDESEPEVSEPDESEPEESEPDTPQLSDNSNFVLWASLLTISVIGLAVLHINRRRIPE